MRPQNRQKLKNVFGKIEIFLAQNPIFLAQNLIFFNGFLDFQEIRENLLQRLSDLFNGFSLSLTHFYFP
jgi:hypothetical protein